MKIENFEISKIFSNCCMFNSNVMIFEKIFLEHILFSRDKIWVKKYTIAEKPKSARNIVFIK